MSDEQLGSEQGSQKFVVSARESFPDDLVVELRLRPDTLRELGGGVEVCFLRLDAARPAQRNKAALFDLYIERSFEQGPYDYGADANFVKGSPTLETWRREQLDSRS